MTTAFMLAIEMPSGAIRYMTLGLALASRYV